MDRAWPLIPLPRARSLRTLSAMRSCGIRRDDINVVGLNPQIVHGFGHRHGCGAGKKLCQGAFMLGIEVLDEDKSQARIDRQMLQATR